MKKYFPILISKKGEIVALQHLEQSVKDEVSPVIEVIDSSIMKILKSGGYEYKNDLEKFFRTHWSFFGNQIIMDFSLFQRWDLHKEKIRKLLHFLLNSGVNVIPAIEKNSSKIYTDIVKELVKDYNCDICIKESVLKDGFFDFNNDVNSLAKEYGISEKNILLILDLKDIDDYSYKSLTEKAIKAIKSLNTEVADWKDIVVASSSFPENLSNFSVSPPEHRIHRYEWEVWKIITSMDSIKGVKYGDYGAKSARYVEVSFPGTISLKYTGLDSFVIFRGKLTTYHELGHRQFIKHCQELIKNESYSKKEFCWGDLRYYQTGSQDYEDVTSKTGNTTQWVQFCQNHHISLMHSIL